MRLALLGDVMLGRGVAKEIRNSGREPADYWGDAIDPLHSADLVVANLECAITTHPDRWTRTPKVFHFGAPPEAVDVLEAAGIRLVSLANNHVLDFQEQGLRDTLEHLDRARIAHAGAGRDAAEAARPVVVEAAGVAVGMIAFTDNEPGWRAGEERPGTSYVEIRPGEENFERIARRVEAARSAGAELVILSLHGGPNMVVRPRDRFREFARGAIERGVDLIHGHSAHVFQGVELRDGRPILHDTGDALDDYAVDPDLRNDLSILFLLEVADGAPRTLEMVPLRLRYARTELAEGEDREWVLDRMRDLSAELGTEIERTDGSLRLALGEA